MHSFPPACSGTTYRTLDVYGKRVATLAILADTDPSWRTSHYELNAPGTRLRFDFSVCKLLDLVADNEGLKTAGEPSAIVILANWAVQQAGNDGERRLALKWELTRRLYESGMQKADILELFRLVDWLMKLPSELEARFREQVFEFEAKQIMPYITSIERYGIEQGIKKGIEQGMETGRLAAYRETVLTSLEARFGSVPKHLSEHINAETDLNRLQKLLRAAATCAKLDDFHAED